MDHGVEKGWRGYRIPLIYLMSREVKMLVVPRPDVHANINITKCMLLHSALSKLCLLPTSTNKPE